MVLDNIHPDFLLIQKLVYEPCGLLCSNITREVESAEYGACTFDMNDRHILFRVGKVTPTKVGQFVTLWKRVNNGPIMPYDVSDSIDFFIVAVRNKNNFGQFVFPKSVMYEKGVLSKNGQGGKRAIRIYPAWDLADNPQAKRTQAWQLNYFFEINNNQVVDQAMVEKLFY
ncbi:MAG TPA: MepB family protein [Candidatus Babeliales bacterium]|nr:MepB family protein [Candidatus Babeliales bacterium]